MMPAMTRIPLLLRPLDTLFFRDGRPFEAASDARGGLPQPQTLWGALMTHLLQASGMSDWSEWKSSFRESKGKTAAALTRVGLPVELAEMAVRGPWLTRVNSQNGAAPDVLFPAPVNLVEEAGDEDEKDSIDTFVRLDPLPAGDLPPGWTQLESGRRPLWARKTNLDDPVTGYLTLAGMKAYLGGGVPDHTQIVPPHDLFGYVKRVGIGLDAARQSVEEGLLYTIQMLSLKPGVAFYAELELPEAFASSALFPDHDRPVLHWGGEGRRVEVHRTRLVEWPGVSRAADGKSCYVLISPGLFGESGSVGRDNWMPDVIPDGARFVSAAIPGFGAVSGWDLAIGGPKPTRFTVPAGCVYYFENDHTEAAVPNITGNDLSKRQGYGLVLKGVWNDA